MEQNTSVSEPWFRGEAETEFVWSVKAVKVSDVHPLVLSSYKQTGPVEPASLDPVDSSGLFLTLVSWCFCSM